MKSIKINNIWQLEGETNIYANALLYLNNKLVADIVISENENNFKNNILNKSKLAKEIEKIVYANFDNYMSLPKITEGSFLLKKIFNEVYNYDGYVYGLYEEDYELDHKDRNPYRDIKELMIEVEKYKLDDVIEFDSDGYLLQAYPDLITRFNNDIDFEKEKNREMER